MISKLRQVLLTQNIGAFLIALLIWQAAVEIISQIVRTGYWWYYSNRHESLLADRGSSQYRWDNLVLSMVSIALYLIVAYGIARWLYPPQIAVASSAVEDEPPPGQPDAP